jgi:transcription elongation factor Elf1
MIYSFPAGDSYSSLTDFNQPRAMCPHCKHQTVMVSVFQKYNHINWFPMYTKGRTYEVLCTNCRAFDNMETFSQEINAYAAEQCKLAGKRARLLPILAAAFWIAVGTFVLSIVTTFL